MNNHYTKTSLKLKVKQKIYKMKTKRFFHQANNKKHFNKTN